MTATSTRSIRISTASAPKLSATRSIRAMCSPSGGSDTSSPIKLRQLGNSRMLTTLYGKLATVLLGLLCLIGGLYVFLTLVTTRLYCQEVAQKLNRTLAQHLLAENMPLRGGTVDNQALQD